MTGERKQTDCLDCRYRHVHIGRCTKNGGHSRSGRYRWVVVEARRDSVDEAATVDSDLAEPAVVAGSSRGRR